MQDSDKVRSLRCVVNSLFQVGQIRMKASHLGSWDSPYTFQTQPTNPEESCVSKTQILH